MAEPTEATANQALPFPDEDQPPADIPLYIQRLAEAVEKKLVQVFATASERDTKLASGKVEGMLAYVRDSDSISFWTGTAWQQIYPNPTGTILYSSGLPNNSQGKNGDLWVQY